MEGDLQGDISVESPARSADADSRTAVCGGGDAVGLWEVGLLEDEDVVRSKAPILEFKEDVKDSFLALTGEDVLDTARGGGEENLRHRRGDFPSTICSPLLFGLAAKNNSNDLTGMEVKGLL